MEILNYINGDWVKPGVKEYFDVINPATGEVIARTPLGNKVDVDAAAKAASEGYYTASKNIIPTFYKSLGVILEFF